MNKITMINIIRSKIIIPIITSVARLLCELPIKIIFGVYLKVCNKKWSKKMRPNYVTRMPHLRRPFTQFMVVGLGKGGRKFHRFGPDDQISLVPEPDNEYDQNAIMVLVDDEHVGYVARDYTSVVHRFLGRKTSENIGHRFGYYVVDVFDASVRVMMVDLTLAMKRIKV
jgi:hypothetical protein